MNTPPRPTTRPSFDAPQVVKLPPFFPPGSPPKQPVAPPPPPPESWACLACTFHNSNSHSACSACETPKGVLGNDAPSSSSSTMMASAPPPVPPLRRRPSSENSLKSLAPPSNPPLSPSSSRLIQTLPLSQGKILMRQSGGLFSSWKMMDWSLDEWGLQLAESVAPSSPSSSSGLVRRRSSSVSIKRILVHSFMAFSHIQGKGDSAACRFVENPRSQVASLSALQTAQFSSKRTVKSICEFASSGPDATNNLLRLVEAVEALIQQKRSVLKQDGSAL